MFFQKSHYSKIGYPFSKEEFLPHITIFRREKDYAKVSEITQKINDALPELFDNEVKFKKLVVFSVGEGGACLENLFEKEI